MQTTYSLISLHSGANDADMMIVFLTGSPLWFPSVCFEKFFTSHKSMLLLVGIKLGSEACHLAPLLKIAPAK